MTSILFDCSINVGNFSCFRDRPSTIPVPQFTLGVTGSHEKRKQEHTGQHSKNSFTVNTLHCVQKHQGMSAQIPVKDITDIYYPQVNTYIRLHLLIALL